MCIVNALSTFSIKGHKRKRGFYLYFCQENIILKVLRFENEHYIDQIYTG